MKMASVGILKGPIQSKTSEASAEACAHRRVMAYKVNLTQYKGLKGVFPIRISAPVHLMMRCAPCSGRSAVISGDD
jgi:hypothetical protein